MNAPSLRFPEFAGEWQQKTLEELDVEISDGNYGEMYPTAEQFVKEGVPFIRANNLRDATVRWDDMRFITPELHKVLRSGHLELSDILVTTRGEIGLVSLVPEEFVGANINAQLCLLRNATSGDQYFIFNYLIHPSAKRQFVELTTGSALKQLPRKNLKKIRIGYPSLPEQKKIAAFLGVVDAKIAALRDRVAGLERYKRGLMQTLFSQSLRFTKPDGTPFPDWKEKRLGEVAAINKGKQLNRDTLDTAGRYLVVNGGVAPSGYHDAYNTEAGAITISEGGNSCGFVGFQRTQFWSGGHCYVLAPNRLLINNDFLFQVLKFEELSIMRLRVGSGLPNIQKGDLTKFALPIPHPDEQAKIAKALSAMDAKIAAVTDQLARMQDFKKGLLQQMFV